MNFLNRGKLYFIYNEKMKELTTQLKEQMGEGKKPDEEIKKNLEGIGYGV